MPNIAALLKTEIARIARKEVRQQTEALRRSATGYRREIAALKRRTLELERRLRKLGKPAVRSSADVDEADGVAHRFSANGFASLRKRLGLSAADLGLLIGASAISVYKWEQGKARPREKYLGAIAAVRGIGKREAVQRLEAMR